MGTAGIAMALSLRVGGDGTVSPGRWRRIQPLSLLDALWEAGF